jgi:hypothetical protein
VDSENNWFWRAAQSSDILRHMLLVIFGAGASYDSIPTYPPGTHIPTGDTLNKFHRPPLANELFENRPVFAEAITSESWNDRCALREIKAAL